MLYDSHHGKFSRVWNGSAKYVDHLAVPKRCTPVKNGFCLSSKLGLLPPDCLGLCRSETMLLGCLVMGMELLPEKNLRTLSIQGCSVQLF